MLNSKNIDTKGRLSVKNKDFKQQNKNLFQINEDEEEEPFSATKNNYSDIQIDDTNTKMNEKSRILQNSNLLHINGQNQTIEGKKLTFNEGLQNVVICDPPQFCSQNKENNENTNQSFRNDEKPQQSLQNAYSQGQLQNRKIKSQFSNYNQRPKSQIKHSNNHTSNINSLANIQTQGALSDSTTYIDPRNQQDLSSKMLLAPQDQDGNMILIEQDFDQDHDLEKQKTSKQSTQNLLMVPQVQYTNRFQATGQISNRLSNGQGQNQVSGRACLSQGSKDESKEEESSRILMMQNCGDINSSSRESLIARNDKNQKQNNKKMEFLSVIILLLIICGTVLCSGFITYSFYNMTTVGLQNSLSIFGIAIFLDMLILRVALISMVSILTTVIKIKEFQQLKQQKLLEQNVDDEQLCLLGEIYEDYDTPISFMPGTFMTFNSEKSMGSPQEYKSYITQQKLQEINPLDHPDYLTNNDQRSPESFTNRAKKQKFKEYQLYHFMQKQQAQTLNEKINQRLMKANQNRKGQSHLGEIVLVDATYFYHQPQNMPLSQIKQQVKEFNVEQHNINNGEQPKKKMTLSERLQISQTLQFNAVEEELRMRKSHAEKLRNQNDDNSNYDIEEIPMNSAQKQKHLPEYINPYMDQEMNKSNNNINNHLSLPPIFPQNHQFETPKGLQNNKMQFQLPSLPGVNASQQIITFNDLRDSKQDSQQYQFKDILASGLSNSSKKQKALLQGSQDYQSLQKYLDDDKENQNSVNNSVRKSLGLRASLYGSNKYSNKRQDRYIDEHLQNVFSPQYQDPQTLNVYNAAAHDELIKFTPQYTSINKNKTLNQSKLSGKGDFSRKSLALPEMFSDFKNKNLITTNQKSRKSSSNTKKANLRQSLNVKTLLTAKKSIQSPSSIKENLEERMNKLNSNNIASIKQQSLLKNQNKCAPNVSPFNVNKILSYQFENNDNEETYIEPPTMNMPSPRDINVMQSIDMNIPVFQEGINYNDNNVFEPKIRESTSSNLKQFLQPQLLKQRTVERQKNRASQRGQNNNTTESSCQNNDSTMQLNFQNELNDKKEKVKYNSSIEKQDLDTNIQKSKPKILPKKKNIIKRTKNDSLKENQRNILGNTFQTEQNQRSGNNFNLTNANDDSQQQLYNLENLIDDGETDNQDINKSIHEQNLNDISRNIHNKTESNQIFDDGQSFKSKLFEDSDSSTIKMIKMGGGLGSRQRSKQALVTNQDYQTQQDNQTEISSLGNTASGAIDFYSNVTNGGLLQKINQNINEEKKLQQNKLIQDYKTSQNNKKSKKQSEVADIIVEENLASHNSSPEKNPKIAILQVDDKQLSLEKSNKMNQRPLNLTYDNEQVDTKIQQNDDDFNMMNQFMNTNNQMMQTNYSKIQPTDEESFEGDTLSQARESNFAQPFINKQAKMTKNRYRSNLRSEQSNDRNLQTRERQNSSSDVDNSFVTNRLRQQEELRKQKEDNEMLQFRIEDQRRKLKNFLKLAKQLKSTKDEKKIKEFLKYLKTEQKPLPYAKINELKSLEIMSSPYNQSLIDMIKDEYDQSKKNDKKLLNNEGKSKKSSRSQQRSDLKAGQMINKLSGIYGQQIGNSSSHRKDVRAKSRGDSQQTELRSKNLQTAQQQQQQQLKLVGNARQKMSRESSNSTFEAPMLKIQRRQQRNQINIIDGGQTTNQSLTSQEGSANLTGNTINNNLNDQLIRVENYDIMTEDEENQNGGVRKRPMQNQILEIRDSQEFNNIQEFM